MTGRAGLVLAVVLALFALALAQLVDLRSGALRLTLDPSFNRLLPDDDPARVFYDHVRRLFGSDETLLVALAADDVFTPEVLRSIERMTSRIEAIRGVHHVVSLANALDIKADEGELLIEPFLSGSLDDPATLAAIRERALANPIYAGNLVSRDGQAAALLVYLVDMTEFEYAERDIGAQIDAVVEAERGDARAFMTGGPEVKAAITRVLLADLARMLPLAFAIVAAVAFVAFRSIRGMLIPAAAMTISLVWTMAVMAVLGLTLNLVTTIVPILIVTVGFAYAAHVMSEYYARHAAGTEPAQLARDTLAHVALPVLLTGLTTAVGFAALAASPLGAVREFGVFAVVGVLTTALTTLTFTPAALHLLPAPRAAAARGGGAFDRAVERLGAFDLQHRRAILVAAAVLVLLAAWGVTRIRVGTEVVTNFDPSHPIRQAFETVNTSFDGANAFYVVIDTDYRDAFKEPANLHAVADLQAWLETQPEIGGTTSLVDYIKLINQGFHDGDPAQLAIPRSKALTSQLLFFGANDELDSFVDSQYKTVNVLVRSRVIDSSAMSDLIARIEERLAVLPKGLDPVVTGNSVLIAQTIDEISRGQALSLSIAFVAIYVILALLFTSFRVGLLALVPNALPVLAYFGLLGLTGVTLNATTGLVACMVLGIAVDDTIHFLARFNHEAKLHADERRGVIEALRGVGRPVTTTTVALCLGFLVLTMSTLRNQVEFGVLAAVTLAFAWVVDVVLTPALTSGMRIVSLWDSLTLDLGTDPQLSIPIFRGLTKRQARIAALMMRIDTYPQGHRLCEQGAEGNDMWVVIEGTLSATTHQDGHAVPLRSMERGDVVGEVALFQGRRTADVVAETDVRLLAITREDLERLPRRRPAIASHVFRNLSEILADRLAVSTARLR